MKSKLTALALLIAIVSMAQDYPTQTIDGVEYYVYTVQKSEGLYAISKKFNVLQSEIYQANPGVDKGLKLGQTLLIPVKKDVQQSEIESAKVIEHIVVPKQTLFSIGKIYGVSDEEILKINPELEVTKIKAGQTVKIPVSNTNIKLGTQSKIISRIADKHIEAPVAKQLVSNVDKKNTHRKKFVTYEVKNRKETLYSISKQFDVTINEILEANPEAENGIKKGDILQIPIVEENIPKDAAKEQQQTVHLVQSKETVYGIGKKYNVSQEALLAANPQLKSGLKAGDTLIIPNRDTTATSKPANQDTAEQISFEPLNSKKNIRIAYLLPFSGGDDDNVTNIVRFVEFYRGSLLAMEDLKKSGTSLEVFTFDTQLGTSQLTSILSEIKAKNVDMIVGPAYPEQVSAVSAFAKKNGIIQIVPFTSLVHKPDVFDMFYQFNPSLEDIYKTVSQQILDEYDAHNIIFIDFDNTDKKYFPFAELFKKYLKNKSIKFQDFSTATYDRNQMNTILKDNKNLFVINACNQQEFSDFVMSFKELNAQNCAFLGSEELAKNYLDKRYSSAYDVIFKDFVSYSLFDSKPSEAYMQGYKSFFGQRIAKSTPNYDLIGYDLTLYFCSALQEGNSLIFNNNLPLQQSKLKFVKLSAGFVNIEYFVNHIRQ
ncbi:MAG: LysM peptidoglycan-binding domain-containing protein [Prevotellaceae bacterium]|jgi:LysM repeat protein/ABC-type branched-subunit amino acid transport system substrate-binding protein|nr:LysM peptidoglycan-binding domain-containing protein [Prevotellaceae bacterium]